MKLEGGQLEGLRDEVKIPKSPPFVPEKVVSPTKALAKSPMSAIREAKEKDAVSHLLGISDIRDSHTRDSLPEFNLTIRELRQLVDNPPEAVPVEVKSTPRQKKSLRKKRTGRPRPSRRQYGFADPKGLWGNDAFSQSLESNPLVSSSSSDEDEFASDSGHSDGSREHADHDDCDEGLEEAESGEGSDGSATERVSEPFNAQPSVDESSRAASESLLRATEDYDAKLDAQAQHRHRKSGARSTTGGRRVRFGGEAPAAPNQSGKENPAALGMTPVTLFGSPRSMSLVTRRPSWTGSRRSPRGPSQDRKRGFGEHLDGWHKENAARSPVDLCKIPMELIGRTAGAEKDALKNKGDVRRVPRQDVATASASNGGSATGEGGGMNRNRSTSGNPSHQPKDLIRVEVSLVGDASEKEHDETENDHVNPTVVSASVAGEPVGVVATGGAVEKTTPESGEGSVQATPKAESKAGKVGGESIITTRPQSQSQKNAAETSLVAPSAPVPIMPMYKPCTSFVDENESNVSFDTLWRAAPKRTSSACQVPLAQESREAVLFNGANRSVPRCKSSISTRRPEKHADPMSFNRSRRGSASGRATPGGLIPSMRNASSVRAALALHPSPLSPRDEHVSGWAAARSGPCKITTTQR